MKRVSTVNPKRDHNIFNNMQNGQNPPKCFVSRKELMDRLLKNEVYFAAYKEERGKKERK